jgi:hypothetical protein
VIFRVFRIFLFSGYLPAGTHTGGTRHNLFEIYYFEKLYAPRARALALRAKVGGMSQL